MIIQISFQLDRSHSGNVFVKTSQNKTSLKQVGSASYKDIASVEKHRSACHTECGSKPSAFVIPVAISEKRDWGKPISNVLVKTSF